MSTSRYLVYRRLYRRLISRHWTLCIALGLMVVGAGCAATPRTLRFTAPTTVALREPARGRTLDVPPVDTHRQDDLAQAIDRLYRLRVACGRSPRTCAVDALAAPSSPYHVALTALMAFRATHQLATVAGHGTFRYRIESTSRLADGRIQVHTCATDSLVVFDTSRGSPGIVFDDRVVTLRSVWTLVEHEGAWKWSDEQVIERRWEAGGCGEFS